MIKRKLKNHPTASCNVIVFGRGEQWLTSCGQRIGALNSSGYLFIDYNTPTQLNHLKWWAEELGIDTKVIDNLAYNRDLVTYNIYTGGYFNEANF